MLVDFQPKSEDQRWRVETRDKQRVCELPCRLWVGSASGLELLLPGADAAHDLRVSLPDDLGYSPGERLHAVANPRKLRSVGMVVAGSILLAAGAAGVGVCAKFARDEQGTAVFENIMGTFSGIGALIGVIMIPLGATTHAAVEITRDNAANSGSGFYAGLRGLSLTGFAGRF